MPFHPGRPYNELPTLPPTVNLETRQILKACIEARVALAEMKAAGPLIPNQAILVNSIPILEAQASSEIENVITTADRLFRFASEAEHQADPATREALRYRRALYQASQALAQRPMSVRTAIEICRTIKGVETDIRVVPGTALMNDVTGEIVYTPPEGADLLREKLANWERYIHAVDDVDPLIRMAVMHYQFEAIHPFADGNGRTGRILNVLFLMEKGLIDIPILYLSRYITRNKSDYYRLLLEVTTKGAWVEWILYVLDAVRETSLWTTSKITAVRELLDSSAQTIRDRAPKIYTRELADIVFVKPYCRIGDLVDAGIAQRQAASTYLKALVEIGILTELKAGREKLFINTRLLRLLSDQA